jgi:UDP-N-acetylmuramoylalanine--D-glutamate ligase
VATGIGPGGPLAGAHVLVAGARRTGASVVDVLIEVGATVTVADADPNQLMTLDDRKAAFTTDLGSLPAGCDLVVTSPGFRPDSPLARAAHAADVEMIGEPELAWRLGDDPAICPDGPPRWLAITGTNGKTTTTGMLEAILLAAGEDAVACGNIGLPIVDALRAGHRVLAVELSSFQLEWSPSVAPYAGAVLNVADDHLDWHGSMAAYAAAKARVLRGGIAVAGLDDERAAGLLRAAPAPLHVGFTRGEPEPGELGLLVERGLDRRTGVLLDRAFPDDGDRRGTGLAALGDIAPPGPPGEANALAAAALARAHGVPAEAVAAGLRAYAPGAHRGAVVAEANGVRWVDDSKATNPHAAAASLAAHERVVWLAGGMLKGANVDDLVLAHRARLAGVVVFGVDRGAILDAVARHAPEVPVADLGGSDDGRMDPMLDAASAAASMAGPGDVVLLAPAAASMDMFRDYGARGDAFAAAAQQVAAGAALDQAVDTADGPS